jgi:hypothetical protein
MASRYLDFSGSPQPTRRVVPAYTDILHPLKMGERIDNLAQRYYGDPNLAWVIMCANPEWENDFDIPIGTKVRVGYPLQRIYDGWLLSDEL